MEKIYTDNLKEKLFTLLKKFNSQKANIMISGGSLLSLLKNEKIKELNTKEWSIYYADERLTKEENEINFLLSRPFLNLIDGQAFQLKCLNMDLPHMDMILLGIGHDGHICSLFPNHPILESSGKLALIENSPKYPPKRITVTLNFLNEHSILYFFLNREKAAILTEPHPSIMKKLKIKCIEVYIEK